MKWLKRIGLTLLVLIAIGLLYRVTFIYRWRRGDCAARVTSPAPPLVRYPQRLVVMTYNIEGDAELLKGADHIAQIAGVINQIRPDIVGLNEVHRGTWQARFRDQPGRLERLTHMNGVFGSSYYELGGAFGNVILTRGKVLSWDVHNLPASGEPRTLLHALIEINGVPLDVFVIHVASWGSLNSGIRAKQLACAANHADAGVLPRVLTGDLNAPPEAAEIAAFRRAIPAFQLCGENIGPTQKVLKERIDYIFADRGWQVRSVRALDVGPSDHRPVIAELIHE